MQGMCSTKSAFSVRNQPCTSEENETHVYISVHSAQLPIPNNVYSARLEGISYTAEVGNTELIGSQLSRLSTVDRTERFRLGSLSA
jgi:hypothetical protein